jgi:hypothetical protein
VPRPRHRLQADHVAVRAAQAAQLALDHAPVSAQLEVAPALEPAVMNLQLPARLTAQRAHASTAAQADRHHNPLGAEAHDDDGRPRQTQQPLECGGDARVVLLRKPPSFITPAACTEGGGASITTRATRAPSRSRPTPRKLAPNAAFQAARSPPKPRGDPIIPDWFRPAGL